MWLVAEFELAARPWAPRVSGSVWLEWVAVQPTQDAGLRERKKKRTRETIIRVAIGLFAEQGFRATTLAQIAYAADVSPSTLHCYFPCKEDILFSPHDSLRATIRARIVGRPPTETVDQAIADWITQIKPAFAGRASRQHEAIIEGDAELRDGARLRFALMEDDFTEAFADALGKQSHELQPRLMASVVMHGLVTIWDWWFPQQPAGQIDTRNLAELETTYLMSLVGAAESVLRTLPDPTPSLSASPS